MVAGTGDRTGTGRRKRLLRLPPSAAGMRIGLYGGSFNPAHDGHLHVTRVGLRRLGLDRLWWLVSPGNPLKSHDELAPLDERLAVAEAVAAGPRIAVTGFEADHALRFTVQTLRWLRRRLPDRRFVWIMGADSLASFHRWKGYREIAALVPIAVVDRPGSTLSAVNARGAQLLRRYRVDERSARALADLPPPAWMFLHGPRSTLSSTALRDGPRGAKTKPSLKSRAKRSTFFATLAQATIP